MNYINRLLAGVCTIACAWMATAQAAEAQTATQDQAQPAQKDVKADVSPEENKKISAALGHFLGRNLNTPGINFDLDAVIQGMREGAAGKPAPMTEKEFEETMAQLQKREPMRNCLSTNLKAADEFLKENANKEGVVVLEPGKLEYLIVKEGTGPVVGEHGNPEINYTGKYIDGTTFSSSADVGGPINIPLDQTIPGFSKGIKGMKEGETRRLFIHPELGYGTMGQLPPNSL